MTDFNEENEGILIFFEVEKEAKSTPPLVVKGMGKSAQGVGRYGVFSSDDVKIGKIAVNFPHTTPYLPHTLFRKGWGRFESRIYVVWRVFPIPPIPFLL